MARSITVIPAKQISTAESGTAQSVQKLKMAAYCRVSTDQEGESGQLLNKLYQRESTL